MESELWNWNDHFFVINNILLKISILNFYSLALFTIDLVVSQNHCSIFSRDAVLYHLCFFLGFWQIICSEISTKSSIVRNELVKYLYLEIVLPWCQLNIITLPMFRSLSTKLYLKGLFRLFFGYSPDKYFWGDICIKEYPQETEERFGRTPSLCSLVR